MSSSGRVRVAVLGATGYAGVELLRLLARHPHVEIAFLSSEQYRSRRASEVQPFLADIVDLELSEPGAWRQSPQLREVRATNRCAIGWHRDDTTGRAIVMTAIDNLGKGAAGQAVQCLNVMLGLPETAGLEAPALVP